MPPLTSFLSLPRLVEVLDRFPALKIGVAGDIGLDAYWYVDMTRSHLSRETPHFPRPVVREVYGPGAGANVAQNLAAAGVGGVRVFSVVGSDLWAERLKAELAVRGIDTSGIGSSDQHRTTAYIKPVLIGYNSQQEDARLDFENTEPLPPAAEDQLLAEISQTLPELDALVVADQLEMNGVVTPRVRSALNELAASHPNKIFLVDSRTRIRLFHHMVAKPNGLEAAAAFQPEADPHQSGWEELCAAGQALCLAASRPAFITLSEGGVLVCDPDRQELIPAAPVRPPLDVVGAGDAFLGALAAALAAGASPWEAGALANLAAAVTVEKLNQTGTATPAEILARYHFAELNHENEV